MPTFSLRDWRQCRDNGVFTIWLDKSAGECLYVQISVGVEKYDTNLKSTSQCYKGEIFKLAGKNVGSSKRTWDKMKEESSDKDSISFPASVTIDLSGSLNCSSIIMCIQSQHIVTLCEKEDFRVFGTLHSCGRAMQSVISALLPMHFLNWAT